MLIDNRKPICIEDAESCIDRICIDVMVKEFQCPQCGMIYRIPIIAREEDVLKFNSLMNIIKKYLKKHPEIEEELMKEFIDDLLDIIGGRKEWKEGKRKQ